MPLIFFFLQKVNISDISADIMAYLLLMFFTGGSFKRMIESDILDG